MVAAFFCVSVFASISDQSPSSFPSQSFDNETATVLRTKSVHNFVLTVSLLTYGETQKAPAQKQWPCMQRKLTKTMDAPADDEETTSVKSV